MAKKKNAVTDALNKSPINYFSDLFVVTMVIAWIIVIVVMVGFAAYATIVYADTTMWCYVSDLVAVPLTAGGAIWMVKNSVQHAIANNKGERAHMDFPKVDAEDIELETQVRFPGESEKEEASG